MANVRAKRSRPAVPALAVGAVLVVAVGIFLALTHGSDTAAKGPAAAFPSPVKVPVQSSSLKRVGSGRVVGWKLSQPLAGPRDVLVTPNGTVWTTEQDQGVVDMFSKGQLTRYITAQFPGAGAFMLTNGPDDAVWFTGYPGGSIGRVLPDGTVNVFSGIATGSATIGAAEGPGDVMWVTDFSRSLLLRIQSDGVTDQIPVPPAKDVAPSPRDILQGSDGTMWFTDPASQAIGQVSAGTQPNVREFPVSAGKPRSISLGSDGSLWVTFLSGHMLGKVDPSDGSVQVIPVAGATADLNDLAVASDGTLWISEQGPYVLHARPDGSTIERVKLPGGAIYADGISIAPDGTVWTAVTDANMIVSISPKS
jgi:virginiamycin B lyase